VRARLLEAVELAAFGYEQWLRDPGRGSAARAYLAERGLRDETIRAFRLGLAPEGWQNLVDRLASRVSEDVMVQAGLAGRRDGDRGLFDRFRHRLMIPLMASGGAVVGFAARALGDDHPKYLNSPGLVCEGSFVFALDQARRAVGRQVSSWWWKASSTRQRSTGPHPRGGGSGTALTPEHARSFQRRPRGFHPMRDAPACHDSALAGMLAAGLGLIVDLPWSGS
jgi:DNA primase